MRASYSCAVLFFAVLYFGSGRLRTLLQRSVLCRRLCSCTMSYCIYTTDCFNFAA